VSAGLVLRWADPHVEPISDTPATKPSLARAGAAHDPILAINNEKFEVITSRPVRQRDSRDAVDLCECICRRLVLTDEGCVLSGLHGCTTRNIAAMILCGTRPSVRQ
jgi:hypothetical protein